MDAGVTVRALRLSNHKLVNTKFTRAADVVRWLGAVQAQEYPVAKWAVAQRTKGLTDADIEQAFASGEILRTHILRPTWHFVARDDLRWMMALSGPRVTQAMSSLFRSLGLDVAAFRRSRTVLLKSLAGGPLTRNELRVHFDRARIDAKNSIRCASLLMDAEVNSLICSGPRRGNQFTYALFDSRVPAGAAVSRDESLGELTARYFQSRRPATVRDFAWWSGLTMKDAQRGVAISGARIDESNARRPPAAVTAHLLPIYDEYPLSYKDRSAAMPERRVTMAAAPRGGITFTNAVLINGRIAGHWKRDAGDQSASVTIYPMRPWSKAERAAVAEAAARYARFLGVPLSVDWC